VMSFTISKSIPRRRGKTTDSHENRKAESSEGVRVVGIQGCPSGERRGVNDDSPKRPFWSLPLLAPRDSGPSTRAHEAKPVALGSYQMLEKTEAILVDCCAIGDGENCGAEPSPRLMA
jgi:hypothetical protein